MKERTLREEYFSWLCNQIRYNRTYTKLCKELNSIRFRWTIHNDDNRASDGLNLRYLFVDEKCLDEGHLEVQGLLKGEATVLEVLVALAMRMNDLMYDLQNQENTSGRWFREMLVNLELAECTDNSTIGIRFDEMTELKIWKNVEVMLDRTYDSNGCGSLFPIKGKCKKDMRKVEIWYQLMLYIEENYRR